MRRAAVLALVLAGTTNGVGCTAHLLLPDSVPVDGGGLGGQGAPGAGGFFGQGGRNGGTGGANGRVACKDSVRLPIQRPDKSKLLIALGRNASMGLPYLPPATTTKMSAVQQALDAFVFANQAAISFGYEDFPKGQCPGNSTCCSDNVDYNFPGPNLFQTIDHNLHQCDSGQTMYGCVSQSDSRPIADALDIADSLIFTPPNSNDDADRYLVLLVDGPAACTPNSPDPCIRARNMISSLSNSQPPVSTYVLPIGQDADADPCLQKMAFQAGLGTASSPFAYLARDPNQLKESLYQIGLKAGAPSCLINLQALPPDPSNVSLFISGVFVPELEINGQDGWNFVPPGSQTIQVRGTWCQKLLLVQQNNAISVCP